MPQPTSNKGRKITKIVAPTFSQLLKYLNEGMYSCKKLSELARLHYVTVLECTRVMYQTGAVHIGHEGGRK